MNAITAPRAAYFIVQEMPDKVFLVDESEKNDTVTVTNDAEAVCEAVNAEHPGKRIIYRDTQGRWDEMIHKDGVFKRFKPYVPPR